MPRAVWFVRAVRRAALLALVIAIAALAAPAAAQDATQAPSLLERERLTGDWYGWRTRFAEHGFEPYLVYTSSMWSNVDGGIRRGTKLNGYMDLGFGLELEKFGMWRGLHLQTSLHWFQGRSASAELVGVNVAQAVNGWEASTAFRVFDLYLAQRFGDGGVLRAGQIAVDSDFMVSRYAGTMLNASFGDLPSQNANLDAPVYPVAGPGIFASSPLGSTLTGRLGLYTADTAPDTAGNHGFAWRLGNNAGYVAFAELTANAAPLALPGAYTVGGYVASVREPKLDDSGLVYTQWSGWLMVDQALRVDQKGEPVVGVFARISYSPDDGRDLVSVYADAGINVVGPFASRPDDVLAFAGSVVRFADAFLRTRPSDPGGEAVLELSYQIAATPWLVVQPDLQYVIDPVATEAAAAQPSATVLGLEVVVTF